MTPLLHTLLDGGGIATYLVVAWYVIKRLNRDESLKRDYPPHRHVNGHIIFPKEFQPARTEDLEP